MNKGDDGRKAGVEISVAGIRLVSVQAGVKGDTDGDDGKMRWLMDATQMSDDDVYVMGRLQTEGHSAESDVWGVCMVKLDSPGSLDDKRLRSIAHSDSVRHPLYDLVSLTTRQMLASVQIKHAIPALTPEEVWMSDIADGE